MNSDTVVKIRRVHHNTGIAMMAMGVAGVTVLCVIPLVESVVQGDLDNLPLRILGTLFFFSIGGAYIWAALQTIVITHEEVQVKLAWFTLRTIPLSEIRTVVYLNYSNKVHNCMVLSLRSRNYLLNHGAAILHSDPHERARWGAIGRDAEEERVKIIMYFRKCFRLSWLKAEEGIWLATSVKNMEKIRNACPHADYITTW
jgi:hypothetical protein